MSENHVILLIIAFFVGLLLFGICCEKTQQDRLKDCYIQEPRTKECQYEIWKYENREKSTHHVVPMPIVIH